MMLWIEVEAFFETKSREIFLRPGCTDGNASKT